MSELHEKPCLIPLCTHAVHEIRPHDSTAHLHCVNTLEEENISPLQVCSCVVKWQVRQVTTRGLSRLHAHSLAVWRAKCTSKS